MKCTCSSGLKRCRSSNAACVFPTLALANRGRQRQTQAATLARPLPAAPASAPPPDPLESYRRRTTKKKGKAQRNVVCRLLIRTSLLPFYPPCHILSAHLDISGSQFRKAINLPPNNISLPLALFTLAFSPPPFFLSLSSSRSLPSTQPAQQPMSECPKTTPRRPNVESASHRRPPRESILEHRRHASPTYAFPFPSSATRARLGAVRQASGQSQWTKWV